MPSTRIKVRREDLLAQVRKVAEADKAKAKAELVAWPAEKATYVERYAAVLDAEAARVRKTGKILDSWRLRDKLPSLPSKPSTKVDYHDRVIAQLEMAVDETLTINVNDYSRYL